MRKLTVKQKWIIVGCIAIVLALLFTAALFVLYVILVTQISLV